MKRITIGIAAVCMGAILPISALASDLLSEGKIEYRHACAVCHGMDGKASVFIDQLDKAPPNLTVIAKQNGGTFPDMRIAVMIDGRELVKAYGARQMPVWGDRYTNEVRTATYYRYLTNQDPESFARHNIDTLIIYLKSIQAN